MVLSDLHQNSDVPTLVKNYAIFSIYKWGKQHFIVPKFGRGGVVRMLAGETDEAVYQVHDVEDGIYASAMRFWLHVVHPSLLPCQRMLNK